MQTTIDPALVKWFEALPTPTQQQFMAEMTQLALAKKETPRHWRNWLTTLFPRTFSQEFAEHQAEFWRHIQSIRTGVKPPAFFAVWPRGGGKTTNVEAAAIFAGQSARRKFCLYVRSTQTRANESVQNIASKIETLGDYDPPGFSERSVGKYGQSKGWRMDMLRCANGFNVVAFGLDVAGRGVKLDDYRPDLIIFDDIDDELDTIQTVEKKVKIITRAILPAGSNDAAIIGVQNLIHANSIFSRIVENEADFLLDRVVSGPIPAAWDLTYEPYEENGRRKYQVVTGEPTWEGQDIATIEKQLTEWGPSAFEREAQHNVEDVGGIFEGVEFTRCRPDEVPELVEVVCWVDPAVTSTDNSDNCGIQIDGLGVDDKIYRLYSWEKIASPSEALTEAILMARHYKSSCVGVETDQGGDTWEIVYDAAWARLVSDGEIPEDEFSLEFRQEKAGAGHGPKAHRGNLMLTAYEQGKFIHVLGTHNTLEKALHRFLVSKPYDLADAAFWSYNDLTENMVTVGSTG